MNKPFRYLAWLLVPALALTLTTLLTACGGEEEGEETAAQLVSADPADGSEIPEGATVTLTFDKDPGTLTATGAEVTGGAGTRRTIKVTAETVTLTWDNGGTATLTYTLLPPDTTPPALVSSTPADGATDLEGRAGGRY
ncbi:MAG: hypothetical protein KatS3mg115_1148 [Candidatus Poribacteria bacterium]|nr:MAG: hypothetical protein KatS3mg115_1148 [Candidatus Poribacteria bacterium]